MHSSYKYLIWNSNWYKNNSAKKENGREPLIQTKLKAKPNAKPESKKNSLVAVFNRAAIYWNKLVE
jgi:hypothetical protein